MRSAPRARSAGGKFQPCVRTRANPLSWAPFPGGRPASTQPACGPPDNLARATRPSKLFLTQFIEYVELFLLTRSAGPGIGRYAGHNRGGLARVAAVASIAFAVWLYLLLARGAFWRCSERDDWEPADLPAWPRVAAVVPARNEADCIGDSIGSLLAQDYGGEWTLILVDDDSSDGTAEIARRLANGDARLRVVRSRGLPAGWGRQGVGGKPGGRCRLGAAAAAGLSAAHRRRYRARARFRQPAGRARRAAAPRAGVAYGQAQLRKLRRARSYSGIHLLLPDALSVLLRE